MSGILITSAPHSRRWTTDRTAVQQLRSAAPDVRRRLQVGLALVWLVDAALQYQPYMFSADFAKSTIASAAVGNPRVVAVPIVWAAGLMGRHALFANAVFATVQLVLAAGLLSRRTTRAALAASIAWAVGVWWFGEGLGGVLSGASPLEGAPGAVVLYALLAVLVWPTSREPVAGRSIAESGLFGRRGSQAGWTVLWASLALMFVLPPANRAPGAAASMISGMGRSGPAPLGTMAHDMASVLAGAGLAVAVGAAVACLLVAVSIFGSARARRAGVGMALLVGLAIWSAENFGALFTGRSTDPNSGPLLMLVAVAFWPGRDPAG